MRRGLPFWLLRLETARCPTCHRDNVWRRAHPERCRWCGASMIDWARLTEYVRRLGASMGDLGAAARAATSVLAAYAVAAPITWTVDVETATHDDLRECNTATRVSRVQVMAPNETEAKLVACQMAASGGRMPTRATVVDPDAEREEARSELAAPSTLRNPLAHAVKMRRLAP
jgi:hypothetical protein